MRDVENTAIGQLDLSRTLGASVTEPLCSRPHRTLEGVAHWLPGHRNNRRACENTNEWERHRDPFFFVRGRTSSAFRMHGFHRANSDILANNICKHTTVNASPHFNKLALIIKQNRRSINTKRLLLYTACHRRSQQSYEVQQQAEQITTESSGSTTYSYTNNSSVCCYKVVPCHPKPGSLAFLSPT